MSHRILLVEDDPVAREVIASLLQSRGHTVDTAEEGFSALQMAQDTTYAVVFIDYHLPEMDGYALARLMRTLGEAANGTMKMVAITADQFGLAARRGVDAVFDSVLAKPIEPERLFAFIDQLLDEPSPLEAVESFLESPPEAARSSRAALALWESRGLGRVPTARVFPSPNAAERANIEACFQISDGAPADCILLLRAAGLGAVEALRRHEAPYLMPLVSLDPALASQADVVFEPGNGESWSATSRVIKAFADRRALLRDDVVLSQAPEIRFAALLFAADRELELLRHASGHAVLSYTAGCEAALVIKAIKQLASQGIIATRLDRGDGDDAPRMFIALSARGLRQLQIDKRESRAN